MSDDYKMPDTENYKFLCNRDCEFFPCHKVSDPDSFNCLFCYCPLYALGPACGGSFTYTERGIKNCSGCAFPHRRENYGRIIGRYAELAELAKKPSES